MNYPSHCTVVVGHICFIRGIIPFLYENLVEPPKGFTVPSLAETSQDVNKSRVTVSLGVYKYFAYFPPTELNLIVFTY